jgi:DNA invertase Pin-like site-specific DNA recombinase
VKYGYARVSTDDQNPALQIAALKKAKCAHIFQDKLTGATTKRPQLTKCLKTLRAGDTLIVWKLDRLARSLRDLITILDDLKQRGVKFKSFTEAIDTETPAGRAMWQMIGIMAEFEYSLISERTRAGVKDAKRRGVKFGRKSKLTAQQINQAKKLIAGGERPDDVAVSFHVGRSTLYRALSGKEQFTGLQQPENELSNWLKDRERFKREKTLLSTAGEQVKAGTGKTILPVGSAFPSSPRSSAVIHEKRNHGKGPITTTLSPVSTHYATQKRLP